MIPVVTHTQDTMTRVGFVRDLLLVAQIEDRPPASDDDRHQRLAVTVYPLGGTQSVEWLTEVPETAVIDLVRREYPRLRDVRITGGPRGVVVVDEPGLVLALGVQFSVEGVNRRGVASAWRAVRGRLLGIR